VQKFSTNFAGLVTSGHHNSALIENAENSRLNNPPTGWMSSFHFTVRINLKSFPWAVRCALEGYPKRFCNSRNYVWYRQRLHQQPSCSQSPSTIESRETMPPGSQ